MACRRPILSDSVVFGEDDTGLEQVAVHLETELAALEIGQALGDGEPQSAALSGPGIVPSDEALEQPSAGRLRGSAEMFFTARTTCPSFRATSTRPGRRAGVLGAVGEEIVQNPPGAYRRPR